MPENSVLSKEGLEYYDGKSKERLGTELNKKVDKISGKGLSTNDYTTAEKNKLAGIATGANKTIVDSELSSDSTNPVQNKVVNSALSGKVPTTRKVNNKALSADITLSASDVGLGNVGNFKAVSTVASQGLTDTEKANARANIGAQAAGSYAATSHTHDDRYYTESEINTKLNGKANSSHTHGNGDITSLDAGKITSGTISIDRLPQGALERLTIVADDTARFKLTSDTVQKGDTVKVTATSKMYYVVDESKLSTEAGYEVYTAGSATSVPWSGVTGKPSTFTPSSHTHDDRYYTETEIDSKLGGKANSSHTHTKSQITDFPTSMPASDVYSWAKASSKPSYTKSEVGLGNVDNTADSAKSVKYATSAGSASYASKATSVVDYGATAKTIQIGYSGDGISGDGIKFIAGYTSGDGANVNAKIKDISKDALKSWLGLGSLAYSSATIPTNTNQLTNGAGYTTNTGTITGIKMNGASKGTSGVVDLGTVLTGGKQSTTSTADGGSNVYTFSDGSTITVKNGSKGSTGAAGSPGAAGKNGSNGTSAAWFTGTAVTGTSTSAISVSVSGSKAGDMYLNTSTANVYRASAANSWIYVCNIKGATGKQGVAGKNGSNGVSCTHSWNGTTLTVTSASGTSSANLKGAAGANGVTPTIKAAAGSNIGSVGTPSVTASTSGTTTTFTFNNLKGAKGDNATTTAVSTQSTNGLMSASDKKKLDGIASGARVASVTVYQSSEPSNQLVNDSWLQGY